MTQDEIIEMAIENTINGLTFNQDGLVRFAKMIAEKEREVVANWIMDRGFATGHGDSIVDLLDQLEWQIADAIRARGQA